MGLQTAFIHKPGHHAAGYGVLAIEIPLSESRPHWLRGTREAFLRLGDISLPMPARTMIDMATRRGSAVVAVF